MSQVDSVQQAEEASSAQQVAAADAPATTAQQSVKAVITPDSSTPIATMNDLRQKSPKIYKAVMMAMAQKMCTKMQEDQQKLEEAKKQYERDQ